MKKTISIVLILVLLTAGVFAATISFKDTKPTDWYMNTVSKLVERGGINGYPDGTFKPNDKITKAEFIKIVMTSLGFEEKHDAVHWANNYIRKAVGLNIIDIKDFPSNKLDEIITRNDMAKVAVKVLEYNKEEFTEDFDRYIYQIRDFNSISNSYRDYVLKAYVKGIITGYPDGTFGGDRGLTRAEASTVIIRILETGERVLPSEPKGPTTELSEEDIKRLQSYPLNTGNYIGENATVGFQGFEEYYTKEREDCEAIYNDPSWSPIGYPPNEIKHIPKENLKWFSSPRLIYYGPSYGIRGILQKTENGKVYEADFEIMLVNSVERGTYLLDKKFEMDYSGSLSEWKEVK